MACIHESTRETDPAFLWTDVDRVFAIEPLCHAGSSTRCAIFARPASRCAYLTEQGSVFGCIKDTFRIEQCIVHDSTRSVCSCIPKCEIRSHYVTKKPTKPLHGSSRSKLFADFAARRAECIDVVAGGFEIGARLRPPSLSFSSLLSLLPNL